eukprot:TRINITY_DN54286_c0_g1_i1.p1 TRINITY_DN54286_c0_g1~~TRINITY_DN54286_c0_g1_i1.p1  ORF type:complete len:239 (+),score=48.29 TRINITY_DN54286_c0_g1_i1:69-719(+)
MATCREEAEELWAVLAAQLCPEEKQTIADRRSFCISGIETPSEFSEGDGSLSGPSSSQRLSSEELRSRLSTWCSALAFSEIGRSEAPRVGYLQTKVEGWFHEVIDVNGTGTVCFREFLAAFRKWPGFQVALCMATGVAFEETERQAHARLRSAAGMPGLSVQERTNILQKERSRAKEVFEMLREGPAEGGATLDAEAFLGFFERRGLLIRASHGGA